MKTEKVKTTLTIFISDDGLRFKTEEECLSHEQKRRDYFILENLDEQEFRFPEFSELYLFQDTWYLIRNESERDAVYRMWCKDHQYAHVNEKHRATREDLHLGDWVSRRYVYDNDGCHFEGVFTLEYIVKVLSEFLGDVTRKTVEGKY